MSVQIQVKISIEDNTLKLDGDVLWYDDAAPREIVFANRLLRVIANDVEEQAKIKKKEITDAQNES